jgi:ABC-2 type transport system ATP-binding protein
LTNFDQIAYNAGYSQPFLIRVGKLGDKVMAEEFLVAQDLHKSFNEHKAVNGVSFGIHRGEIFGLLGPNGAGKTTTIRMLSTVLEPDRGDVIIGGHSIQKNADAVRSIIGVCPQELALYEDLSALDNLVFFGRMAGLASKEARTQAMSHLGLMGLTERIKGRVSKFSGGMKRRVNLAIALMGHPELLFLDEPTVGVDPQSRNNIYETIEGLRDRGMTILYTTHYMDEADRLCGRIAIMDGGKIIATDTPYQLKSQIGSPEKLTLEDVFLTLTGRSLRD